MIFLLEKKNTKFHIFAEGSLNPYSRVLRCVEYIGVVFIKIPWLLGGLSPIFWNHWNLLRLVAFDCITKLNGSYICRMKIEAFFSGIDWYENSLFSRVSVSIGPSCSLLTVCHHEARTVWLNKRRNILSNESKEWH